MKGPALTDDALWEILQRPIAFHPAFVRISGSIKAGLLLSQAFYWQNRTTDPAGWFFKTQEEWERETCLTRREQETAREHLRTAGLLEEERRGIPARLYYRINIERFKTALNALKSRMAESDKQEYAEVPNKSVRNQPNRSARESQSVLSKTADLSSEITSESTAETTLKTYMGESAKTPAYSPAFVQFWQTYPVKKGKDQAWKVWKRRQLTPLVDTICTSILDHQANDSQWRQGYIPHPATFLNTGGWKDELAPLDLHGRSQNWFTLSPEQQRAYLEEMPHDDR